VAAIEQVHPQLQQAQGTVQAMGAQLQQFQQVDWVALATNDPLEYSKVRARYDVLQQGYQQAAQQYQTLAQHVDSQRKAINAEALRVESQKLTERIEEWKDPAKYREGAAKLREYLIAEGAAPDEVDGLSSSLAVSIAWKAMRYDELRKSKQAKVKQMRGAPPMTKPGAAQTPQSAGQRQVNQERARLKESGDWRDAARLLAKMK
jgi:chromosome condensin MukBEF ATPase and DNA-binding subunit MukB